MEVVNMGEDNTETTKEEVAVSDKRLKKLGVIIACILLFIALVIFRLALMDDTPVQETTQTTASSTSQAVTNDLTLKKVTNESALNTSVEIKEAQGRIVDKEIYLYGNQLVYSVSIQMYYNGNSVSLKYFCSYTGYSNVGVGDTVTVSFKQITESSYSIVSLNVG